MISEITQLEIKRRTIIIGNLLGFVVWQLPYLFHYFTSDPSWKLSGWTSAVSIIGWFIWTYFLIRIVQFSRLLRKKRKLASTLIDEYIQVIRVKSFAIGFWVLLGVIVLLVTLSLYVDLKVRFVLFTLIFAGVIAPLVSYLIFEKD
ncbi:hypothetical protein SAMN04487970_1008154 [Paenibacillus tianmuensis]|uniref:Uncharacterized protein n=1 Tax=Paenibacillus tianmuensis TaxID=624147 RepID=A0A1G4QTB7_9BACL|nr:hypothetical protein [Paenibacillus tianmuensis]SCW47259.1 hypothetical protein SAMN04487970_1008154 [Paenibacillus tianmuensis]